MPVPWEALIPFGLLTIMYGVGGTLFKTTRTLNNEGKPPRYGLDDWDLMMMQRDKRLTGTMRGQTANPKAPTAFTTNRTEYKSKPLL